MDLFVGAGLVPAWAGSETRGGEERSERGIPPEYGGTAAPNRENRSTERV